MKVLGGVLSGRGVATADVPAGEAKPEMDPTLPGLQAFLAAFGRGGGYCVDLIEMRALHLKSSARGPLQRRTIPAAQVGTSLISGLEELEQKVIRMSGSLNRLVWEDVFL